jgi:hypothetical protein
MRAGIVVAAVAALAAVPTCAFADSHTVTSKKVAGGSATVTACGTLSATTVSWTTAAGNVTKLSLASIPSGCTGGTLGVTLHNAAGTALGAVASTTVTGVSMTLTVTGSPAANAMAGAALVVSGP